MTSASFESVTQLVSLLFVTFVVIRLIALKLTTTYPFFFSMLLVPLAIQTVAVTYGTGSREFLHTFNRLEPIRMILFILVVWELFSAIFRNYAGLRSLSRWVMGIAAIFSTAGLALTMSSIGVNGFNHSRTATRIIRFERGLTFGLVIFIIIMLYFVSRYPIKLPRNNVVLSMIYSLWFLGVSATLLVMSFRPKAYASAENAVLNGLEIASYVAWGLLLSKSGEFQETRVRQHLSADRERVLIGELNAMNDVLLRAARSISHPR
jgi:hypothetical protein